MLARQVASIWVIAHTCLEAFVRVVPSRNVCVGGLCAWSVRLNKQCCITGCFLILVGVYGLALDFIGFPVNGFVVNPKGFAAVGFAAVVGTAVGTAVAGTAVAGTAVAGTAVAAAVAVVGAGRAVEIVVVVGTAAAVVVGGTAATDVFP